MSVKQPRIGVVIMNLGGPTSEESVRTFLYNLFRDTDIIKLGGGKFQTGLAKTISKFRAPKVAENYKMISTCSEACLGNEHCPNKGKGGSNCCSPINGLTEDQRVALEKELKIEWPDHFVKVYTAMRYWVPFADTTINEIREDEITHVVLLPLYPHFSWTTSGSSFRDWEDIKKQQKKESKSFVWEEFYIKNYHLNEYYLQALNERINESLDQLEPELRNQTHLIFSAHGTPVSEVESGDPYTKQIEETVEAIMARRSRKEQYWLSYQSRVGPMKWTQPNTEDLVKRLLDYGITNFLLIPVAFVTDHIETLCELNIELRETLEDEGYQVSNLMVMNGLNDHPLFIKALSLEVQKQLSHLLPAGKQSELEQKPSKSIVSP